MSADIHEHHPHADGPVAARQRQRLPRRFINDKDWTDSDDDMLYGGGGGSDNDSAADTVMVDNIVFPCAPATSADGLS